VVSTKTPKSHNAALVRELGEAQREAAINGFARALKVVFICQVALAMVTALCALPIEERPLYVFPQFLHTLADPLRTQGQAE
jgi:hypothetical protein